MRLDCISRGHVSTFRFGAKAICLFITVSFSKYCIPARELASVELAKCSRITKYQECGQRENSRHVVQSRTMHDVDRRCLLEFRHAAGEETQAHYCPLGTTP